MANKKCINKRKKLVNKFTDGGDTKHNYTQAISGGIDALNTSISLGSIGSQEDIENRIDNLNNTLFKAKDNTSLLDEWGSFTPMKEVSYTDVGGNSFGDNMKGILSATASGAAAGTAVNPGLGSLIGAGAGLLGGLAGAFVNDYQANKKREELNKEIAEANTRAINSFQNRVNAVDRANDLALMANYAADGGPIKNMSFEDWYKTIPTDRNDTTAYNLRRAYELAPFNELEAWRTSSVKDLNSGKNHLRSVYLNPNTGVYEFMKSKSHPTLHFETDWYNSSDPEAIKFRNNYDLDMNGDYYKYIPKKKADGGFIQHQHGGIFSNGITTINNGGTHEQNPNEGVQIGIDAEGIPNLVEEGELIWNNYVFSNRLKVPKAYYKKLGITGKKDKTFAEVAKSLQKESEERPNDPISKKGLEDSMLKLTLTQEVLRQQNEMKKQSKNKMASGGYNTTYGQPQGDFTNIHGMSTYDPYKESNYPYLEEYFRRQRAINNFPIDKLEKTTSLDLINYTEPELQTFDIESSTENSSKKLGLEDLRYAPVLGSVLGLANDLFSTPDYSKVEEIEDLASKAGEYNPISYTPIGNYLTYKPLDREYSLNKLSANAGATRRAIANSSSPARDAALLAADYNAQGKVGDLIRNAEEYNLAQRQAVEQFNRGTNQANAEMRLQVDRANQAAKQASSEAALRGALQANALRDSIDKQRAASMSANLTNLFDNLGGVGKETYMMDMIRNHPALLYDWLGNYKNNKQSYGGYLTIKNKKKGK